MWRKRTVHRFFLYSPNMSSLAKSIPVPNIFLHYLSFCQSQHLEDTFWIGQVFVARREAGVGYTISSFENGSFVVPDNVCYGVFFEWVFGDFEVF